jgi:hypothetical protein
LFLCNYHCFISLKKMIFINYVTFLYFLSLIRVLCAFALCLRKVIFITKVELI